MIERVAIEVEGVVQGVGFRPFVFRIAQVLGLRGFVRNDGGRVRIEVEGGQAEIAAFLDDVRGKHPAGARIDRLDVVPMSLGADTGFEIRPSDGGACGLPAIPPDLAICEACAREIETPGDRRFRHPFANCTACGPRFTILEALPYDRARTSMRPFAMCDACRAEYDDPDDRRFHAQPIACPDCGPQLTLRGAQVGDARDPVAAAAAAILRGAVVALKAMGGYQLLVDATDEAAVARLRARKHRPHKPFAVMFPSLANVRDACEVADVEADALRSGAAPIVLVKRRASGTGLASGIAPGNPHVGAMLPTTPLHRVLLSAVARPVVCTSGNVSDEPLCITEAAADEHLAPLADVFLAHDRAIVRPVDDSVVRVRAGRVEVLRRARGFAPTALDLGFATPTVLAVGAHLKSTVAVAHAGRVVVSQHLGDLHHAASVAALERTVEDLLAFLSVRPDAIACDLHPDYASTQLAERLSRAWGVPCVRVQHHHAHVAAVIAEHRWRGPVLGFAWDGLGYGRDGTWWGGEALRCERGSSVRVATLRPFRLPGGERAVRDPRRTALGVAHASGDERLLDEAWSWFREVDRPVLDAMLTRGVGAPWTSSLGRLFDAVAAWCGLGDDHSFEGRAAMALESAAEGIHDVGAYPLPLVAAPTPYGDWYPLMRALVDDLRRATPVGVVSARFHEALAAFAEDVAVAERAEVVAISGGCFQNARLASRVESRLSARGIAVLAPSAYPPNDGAVSLGQAYVVAHAERESSDVPRDPR